MITFLIIFGLIGLALTGACVFFGTVGLTLKFVCSVLGLVDQKSNENNKKS